MFCLGVIMISEWNRGNHVLSCHVSHNLNSLKGDYKGDQIGEYIGVIKGDTGSLDCGPRVVWGQKFRGMPLKGHSSCSYTCKPWRRPVCKTYQRDSKRGTLRKA